MNPITSLLITYKDTKATLVFRLCVTILLSYGEAPYVPLALKRDPEFAYWNVNDCNFFPYNICEEEGDVSIWGFVSSFIPLYRIPLYVLFLRYG